MKDTSRAHFSTIDEYIHSFPKEVQTVLLLLRKTIKEELPSADEVISYNMPTFKQGGDSIIYFAGWQSHISLYPFSEAMETSIKEASGYKTSGKGTIQFPINKPLPLDLVRKIVQFRLKEVEK